MIDYWFESGGRPKALLQYLKSHYLRNPEEYSKQKTLPLSALSASADSDTIKDLALLTQTGYLTIKAIKYEDTVFVGYPNMEVKKAIAKLYVEQLLRGKIAGQVGAGDIVEVLNLEDPESLFHILNRLFSSIDYVRYPVHDEASLRAFVQVYFAGAGLDPKIENHNAFGRSDLEVRASSRLWVLEFKVCRKGDNEEKILQEALTQMAERHYGEQDKLQTLSVALVFSLDKKSFTKWASLPLSKDCS